MASNSTTFNGVARPSQMTSPFDDITDTALPAAWGLTKQAWGAGKDLASEYPTATKWISFAAGLSLFSMMSPALKHIPLIGKMFQIPYVGKALMMIAAFGGANLASAKLANLATEKKFYDDNPDLRVAKEARENLKERNDHAQRIAYEGKLGELKPLVEKHGVNPTDALYSAALGGQRESVAYLIGQGADSGAVVEKLDSLKDKVVWANDPDGYRSFERGIQLVKEQAKLITPNSSAASSVEEKPVVSRGISDVVSFDPDIADLVATGNVVALQDMMESRNISMSPSFGQDMLFNAARNYQPSMVEHLIDRGVDYSRTLVELESHKNNPNLNNDKRDYQRAIDLVTDKSQKVEDAYGAARSGNSSKLTWLVNQEKGGVTMRSLEARDTMLEAAKGQHGSVVKYLKSQNYNSEAEIKAHAIGPKVDLAGKPHLQETANAINFMKRAEPGSGNGVSPTKDMNQAADPYTTWGQDGLPVGETLENDVEPAPETAPTPGGG